MSDGKTQGARPRKVPLPSAVPDQAPESEDTTAEPAHAGVRTAPSILPQAPPPNQDQLDYEQAPAGLDSTHSQTINLNGRRNADVSAVDPVNVLYESTGVTPTGLYLTQTVLDGVTVTLKEGVHQTVPSDVADALVALSSSAFSITIVDVPPDPGP